MRTMSSAAPESAIGSASSTSRTIVRSGRTTSIVVGGPSGAPLALGKSAGVSPTFAAASWADGEEPGSWSAHAAPTGTRAGDEPDREPAESADELTVGLHDDLSGWAERDTRRLRGPSQAAVERR